MRLSLSLRIILAALVLALGLAATAAEPKSGSWEGLKNMMSAEEFRAAGLDNLSDEELRSLDRWLLKLLAHESQQLVKADEKIQELQKSGVRHRIVGHFSGWTGKTVFHLDNGEIWKQRLESRYAISLDNPEVEIKKNLLGFYEMKILKTGRRVGVSRVK